jgi:aerobic-type carbon monoxide dehydrogenase small subunit (CoxS/CutS family)
MTKPIRFRLNGRAVTLDTDENRTLLWVLRGDLGLTGTKYGCGEGICGSCTVVVDGKAVRSCQAQLKDVAGKEVTTIEGLAHGETLHPLQQAFIEHGAFQCGYCTPGMLMNAHALLLAQPKPTREAIAKGMEDNLCRCGAHKRILTAVEAASRQGGKS